MGVLRCATPEEYWIWAGKRGAPPAIINDPSSRFCAEADVAWCREMRAGDRCHLVDRAFERSVRARLGLRLVTDDGEEEHEQEASDVVEQRAPGAGIRWETWTGGSRSGESSISIDRTGVLRISALADEVLGKPVAVQLLWCASPRMIGVRGVPKEQASAIVVTRAKTGGFQVGCRGFLAFHEIEHVETRRFKAHRLEQGVIALRLDEEPLAKLPGRGKSAA